MTNSSSVWFICISYIIKVICLFFHLCPCCNHACLSACGLFSRCAAATSNSYKSHYIIASRFALRTALPVRASDWPLKLIGRPLRAGYRSNHKSRLPSRGPVIGESGSPWTVNHVLSCAPRIQRSSLQRAECGATRRAAYQQTTGAGRGDLRMVRTLNRSSDLIANLFVSLFNHFYSLVFFLKYLLFVWELNIYLLPSALVFPGFDSSAREQKQKSSLTLRKSQETKTGVFISTHVEALDYWSRHLFTGSF